MRALILAVIAGIHLVSLPQQAQFRSKSDLVEVYATVRAKAGTLVHDLRADEFELLEDGKRRDITVFSAAVLPLSVALVLDHSGSTVNEFDSVIRASQEFMGKLFREDRVAVSTLFWDCLPFTANPPAQLSLFQTRLPRDDGSPIWSAADRAFAALSQEPGRRIVLLLSDGEDNQSQIVNAQPRTGAAPVASDKPPAHSCRRADVSALRTIGDVISRAERDSVMVYTVAVDGAQPRVATGYGTPSAMGGAGIDNSVEMPNTGTADLTRLSRRSGGALFRLRNYSEVTAAFKTIVDELHLQYLLGFVPTMFDGKRHDITLRVKRDGVTVRARESYVATLRK